MELPGLRKARLKQLLTQAQLAVRAGMTPASISRIETGKGKARISTVRRLADALGVGPADLISPQELPTRERTKGIEL
jgi:transcriptional regulator with XRE-family HTH domain